MAHHNELGKKGEQLAIDFLAGHGYQILERNFRFDRAEVDIIAQKGNILAVIEVKTRSTSDFGNPQDFLKPKQIKNLVKAIDAYINLKDIELDVRFDIVAITKLKGSYNIEHLKDAFYHF